MKVCMRVLVLHVVSLSHCLTTINGKPTPPSADYYIGAVVEFPAHGVTASTSTTQERIRQFERLIDDAAIRPDIVVFPEDVLNDLQQPIVVPAPSAAVLPCAVDATHYDFIISETSCIARSLSLYVLINVMEVENCTQVHDLAELMAACAIYNTNVVFDRGGMVISRYRKYNLIGSEWLYLNYTTQPEEEAIFRADFNVTFGHFTRMDLLYARPAQALVQQGITDFLHPSKWQSELPFMTAIQLHQSWAYANNVNLLVAGTNDPRNGRSGSGIYAGKYGALIASMTWNERQSKLHLSVIPKHGVSSERAMRSFKLRESNVGEVGDLRASVGTKAELDRFTGVQLTRDSDIDLYVTQPLTDAMNGSALQQQLCHNDLCCDFYIERSANPLANTSTISYFYRLAVFRDMAAFLNTEPESVGVCALLACIGDHLYTCGRIYGESVPVVPQYSFDVVRISGNFSNRRESLLTPTSVDSLLMPLAVDEFEWKVTVYGNFTLANLSLVQSRSDLLTLGIYANYFLDDTVYDRHHKDVAGTFGVTLWLLLFPVIMNF